MRHKSYVAIVLAWAVAPALVFSQQTAQQTTPANKLQKPPVRVYDNRLSPLKDPPPLLADHPRYVEPIKTGPRFEAPMLIDDAGADLDVRAWRFSYNARGIIEVPNRLAAKATAIIVVHPWGVDDGQGWKSPEPAGAAFHCTPVKNTLTLEHMKDVINPFLKARRDHVGLVGYSLPGTADPIRKMLYRSVAYQPTADQRKQATKALAAKLGSFSYKGQPVPDKITITTETPAVEYFRQFRGLDASAKFNNAGFWDLPIPVAKPIEVAERDVVFYDGDGYAVLRDFLKKQGIRHVLLAGYSTDMCVCSTTAGYKNLAKDFDVFLVGDATLATFPAHDTPRFATSAAVSFAALDLFITQVSWVRWRGKTSPLPSGGEGRRITGACLRRWSRLTWNVHHLGRLTRMEPLPACSRRDFLAATATNAAAASALCAGQPAGDAPRPAQIAITLDLEMSRNFPTWEQTHWDYEKGNLNDQTKRWAVEACRRVRQAGGLAHCFAVGRVFEQADVSWLRGIVQAGHAIGNHTYDHVNVLAQWPEAIQFRFRRCPWLIEGQNVAQVIRNNIQLTTTALRTRIGIAPAGFRTPGGFTNGLREREDIQRMLQDLGFTWVSSLYPTHAVGPAHEQPSPAVIASIVAAQRQAQPFVYPTGLVEIPMSPISDIGAFRTGRWRLEWFLSAVRGAVEWCIDQRAVFDFLCHPSCMYVVDPQFRTIELICDLVRRAGDRAQLVTLDRIAERFRRPAARS